MTALDLSAELGLPVKRILSHLEHVRKSVKVPQHFVIIPAQCLSCGYIYRNRVRLAAPGRCPRCRSTHIQDPRYTIKEV